MAKIKAVIFDMDGVLIEAKDWHYEALNRALGLFGLAISRYDHLVTYDGLPTKSKLKMISMERGLPEKLHSFINTMKQIYTMEITYARCKPVFYHQYALSRLKHDGYRIVVCSNSIRRTVDVMMEQANLLEYLDFFLSNQDVTQPKPHPEMYLTAIQRLGFRPDQCLIIEDNEHGIKAALASGAHVLKVDCVEEVNYQNILAKITSLEETAC
ncbi:MAG: HAD family phosphatase [Desulfuromonadaceae bacterium]|nr:HAD family phosphatase [Desulfuromonadaceae bacterium]MDD2849536.1 HAD family phosphatase [Desulfuromonadaceae bacterium]MDD4131962.1 HAD family phosphatase [Desulfuromonadaceae bacterium]